ncbi:hypothetical protein MNBD_ALPHA06-1196 [hydrothermal vent metagenome]|uniref:DUF1192 domain-containing protein n=1 Tax=hydrothermal vent metagenome TaxID=652676 RepID=A0A3B0RUZ6_9ZZZZ
MKDHKTLEADEPQAKKTTILGEDLYDFSVEELRERVILLREEIKRVEQASSQKTAGLDAANALFGKS